MERLLGTNLTKYTTPSDFVVIDIETTGLDPNTCEIIEFAAIKVANHQIVDTYSELIKPSIPISSTITDLTGISNDMVKDKRSISEAAIDIHTFIGDSILLGHNVLFDIRFIYDNLLRELGIIFNNNYVDTMWLARYKLKKNIPNAKLGTLSKYLDCPFNGMHHRALADTDVTYHIYEKLINL